MSFLRIVNEEIPMSQIKSILETHYRALGIINDDEDVKLMTFATVSDTTTVVDWMKMDKVPIQLVLKEQELDRITI